MIDVFNSVLGHHFSTITTCQILEKPHHVVLSYICFPLLPFLIILNLCCLHSSHCLCSSFLLFPRTLWSGRRFADLQLLSSSELSELNFLDTLSWVSTYWVQFLEMDCWLRPVDLSSAVNLYRPQLPTINMNWCFSGATLIVFIHVLLKVFCSFQELCLWQYTSSLTLLNRKSTMSF